jgi:hypothetical protein
MSERTGSPVVPPERPEPGPVGHQAPTLADQLLGVFTDPVPLFRRLGDHPRWGPALAAVLACALASGLVWAARVDADALLRPVLAADPRVPPEQLDALIAFQGRFLGVIQAVNILVMVPAMTFLLAGCFWLAQRAANGPRPAFAQCLCAAAVPGLVAIPRFLLVILLCLVQEVGGRTPGQLSPLSLGAWLGPERSWLAALLSGFDLFSLASLVLLFLAARHTLRLRIPGALACVAVTVALNAGLMVLGAR